MLGEQIPEVRILENGKSFKKVFMVEGLLTGNGTVPLVKVLSITRDNINWQLYVDYVLIPLFTEHLPGLYEKGINKVIFHYEKTNSHIVELTTAYLIRDRTELDMIYLE